MSLDFFALPPTKLVKFIERLRKFSIIDEYETYLQALLLNALTELCEFVSSQGVLVLLDDPVKKLKGKNENQLTYIAVMGKDVKHLLGESIASTQGLIGETYTLGKSMVRKSEKKQRISIDKVHTRLEVDHVISVPLKIEGSSIGVVVVYNKKDAVGFTIRDLKLAEIFAGYISTSLQNAIDAKKSMELSKRDDLTGLYNDRHFHAQLEKEVKEAIDQNHPLNLVFMDLDFFKKVNDQYGHLVGSQTLKEVGLILREVVTSEHATLARYGGDEYVMILPKISLDDAVTFSESVRQAIFSKLFMISTPESEGSFVSFKERISASIGVSSLHDHVASTLSIVQKKSLLIKLADAAMYKAKEQGKNCVCVADKLAS
ncbi:MAG: GGDEF domain-containing protein [Bdellovibrionales bacterium]|nr:GGDEF domain-containing protein [Bdellovibrionales bacterium]